VFRFQRANYLNEIPQILFTNRYAGEHFIGGFVVIVAAFVDEEKHVGRGRLGLERSPGHLEEEQEGQLLQVIAIGETVIPEDVAVVPKLLDEGGSGHLLCGRSSEPNTLSRMPWEKPSNSVTSCERYVLLNSANS